MDGGLELEQGTSLGHHEIEALIGAGDSGFRPRQGVFHRRRRFRGNVAISHVDQRHCPRRHHGHGLVHEPRAGAGETLYAVSVFTRSSLEVSIPRLILEQPFDRNTCLDRAAYDVASDGRFLVVTNTWNTELRVVFNWFQELRELVPVE